jgi:hypothetical protein
VHHELEHWGGTLDETKGSNFAQGAPGRKWVALAMLVVLAGLAVKTIDPGKVRSVVLLLLGVFALRIVLAASASR